MTRSKRGRGAFLQRAATGRFGEGILANIELKMFFFLIVNPPVNSSQFYHELGITAGERMIKHQASAEQTYLCSAGWGLGSKKIKEKETREA